MKKYILYLAVGLSANAFSSDLKDIAAQGVATATKVSQDIAKNIDWDMVSKTTLQVAPYLQPVLQNSVLRLPLATAVLKAKEYQENKSFVSRMKARLSKLNWKQYLKIASGIIGTYAAASTALQVNTFMDEVVDTIEKKIVLENKNTEFANIWSDFKANGKNTIAYLALGICLIHAYNGLRIVKKQFGEEKSFFENLFTKQTKGLLYYVDKASGLIGTINFMCSVNPIISFINGIIQLQ